MRKFLLIISMGSERQERPLELASTKAGYRLLTAIATAAFANNFEETKKVLSEP